jgi:hypothetical protein
MKNLLLNLVLAVLLLFVLFPVDISDLPGYTSDEVLEIARVFSPECKVEECG